MPSQRSTSKTAAGKSQPSAASEADQPATPNDTAEPGPLVNSWSGEATAPVPDDRTQDDRDGDRAPDDPGGPGGQAKAPGYVGDKTDPTPNVNYTVEGVLDDKPTPETEPPARRGLQPFTKPWPG